jgi:toxin ParE1/3/4
VKVVFSAGGELAFLEKLEYLTAENPRAAKALLLRVEKALRRLAKFPNSGRRIPEFPHLPYRELVFPPFRFFHRVEGREVWIVAVWHTAHVPEEPME